MSSTTAGALPRTGLIGHEAIWERFRSAAGRGRLGGAYLFVGPEGVGKKTFAMHLAQAVFCQRNALDALSACGQCPSCQLVAKGGHPDLELVGVPADKNSIPVELLIGSREHRMREGLCHTISLSPMVADRRIAIIDDADALQTAGANCLLKTLEEPPPKAMLILISSNLQRQLPTIRSRCKLIRFAPLSQRELAGVLLANGMADSPDASEKMAAVGQGSLRGAAQAVEEAWSEFAAQFPPLLAAIGRATPQAITVLQNYVEKGGKDGPAKRARMRQAVQLAAEFYRRLLHHIAGGPESQVALPPNQLEAWTGDEEVLAGCITACVNALTQIDANVNAATWTHAWLDELGKLGRG